MTTKILSVLAIVSLFSAAAVTAEPSNLARSPEPDPVTANDPAFMGVYTQQYRDAFRDGAISAKYKQLTGVTVAVVVKCEDCLKSHVQSAITLGANRREIVEALRLGLLTGGSAGLPTMGAAYKVMDEAKLQ